MFLKLLFVVSFIDLFITIQYAVFRKSLSTFCVSLYIIYNIYNINIINCVNICIFRIYVLRSKHYQYVLL